MEHSPERELKLAATPDFRMPSIYGLVGPTVRQAPPERNDTTYYDTADLRLARWGASLRRRPGEGWTVKLPAERHAPFLVRPEVVFAGNTEHPPEPAVDLVTGFVRGEELAQRVQMTTIRRRAGLHDSGGRLLAGVVDDAVSVLNGEDPWTFRELEVEIGEEMTPGLLDALVERLRQAGAGAPDQTAKYIRALAPSGPLAPEIAVADLGPDATAGDVVRRAIALSVIRLIRHDPVVRLDADTEGVHQARVATRRLRSDLRTFRPMLDREWSQGLRDELGWIARILGEVRDGDVLLERLTRSVGDLADAEREAADAMLATLARARDEAHADLLATLRSRRYIDLLDRLVDAANAPALADEASEPAAAASPTSCVGRGTSSRSGWRSSATTRPTRGCTRSGSGRSAPATPLRPVRPRSGSRRGRSPRSAARLQDVLGELHDAVVAADWLDAWAGHRGSDEEQRVAQTLAAAERESADELRTSWRAVWDELEAPGLRSWM